MSNYALMTVDFFENLPVIRTTGTFEVKVRNTSEPLPSLSPINEMGTTKIITFNAVLEQDVVDLTHLVAEALAEGKEGVEWEEAGKYLATFNLESNNNQYENAPVKGETVDAIVEKVVAENKSGNSRHEGKEILVIRNIKIQKGVAPTKFKWNFTPARVVTQTEGVNAE